ncbi:hypothetical protein CHCC20335_2071 [Bacillus paralicheniformis]|nr:hypothetical protein CHCC20335_2071 [Bacillus paralicheniformis]
MKIEKTQHEFAKAFGIPRGYVSRIEKTGADEDVFLSG